MTWLSKRKLRQLHDDTLEAKSRYLKLSHAHACMNQCSPQCAHLMDEKRRAKLSWLEAELALKEYRLKMSVHTT